MLPGHSWTMRVPVGATADMCTCTKEILLDEDTARGLGLAVESNYPWNPVIVMES